MTTERISFIVVMNKYILYSEALAQYHTLAEDDQKIVQPYIAYLKNAWQEELKHIQLKVKTIATGKSKLMRK